MLCSGRFWIVLAGLTATATFAGAVTSAEDPAVSPQKSDTAEAEQPAKPKAQEEDKKTETESKASPLVKLAKDYEVWVDLKRKLVVVDGKICLREGQLEMFACPKDSKEHESIVAVNCPARFVHAGLLAVGAQIGRPVQFDPEYAPATGTEVEVLVLWTDEKGERHKVRAQEWIKHLATGKAMTYPWVFAGSGFWVEEQTKQRHYHGDAGDFICVSNFPTATLDLPVKSSQDAGRLLFAAFTERIPPLGTKVRLVLIPKQAKKEAPKP